MNQTIIPRCSDFDRIVSLQFTCLNFQWVILCLNSGIVGDDHIFQRHCPVVSMPYILFQLCRTPFGLQRTKEQDSASVFWFLLTKIICHRALVSALLALHQLSKSIAYLYSLKCYSSSDNKLMLKSKVNIKIYKPFLAFFLLSFNQIQMKANNLKKKNRLCNPQNPVITHYICR